jgi:hypothetical protein
MSQLEPLPDPATDLTQTPGQAKISQGYQKWMRAIDRLIRAAVNGTSAIFALLAGNQTLTGGFIWQPKDFGTLGPGNQTITPNPLDSLKQKVVNNVGNANTLTIAATAQIGDVELVVTNGANPGVLAFTGFAMQYTSDPTDQTAGHKFAVFIYGMADATTDFIVKARQ